MAIKPLSSHRDGKLARSDTFSMTTDTANPDLLAGATAALERRDWNSAFDLFTQADAESALSPMDLEHSPYPALA